ncbi:mitochondrial metalloendopeptidase OMA1 [Corylus avellana]|uniref:mitochondrial metalloendopeptidase OMA1 n=1 Tax=Corylus avellana TaxID=13451 RepID=UPI00286CCB9E|nr:mitochondrial metalloendopeptidase OMA1 [Corylus avellana]XP_059449948.1 mitochondrial metalloendopeptidase OMA1 [Corylus avellana]
MGCYRRTKFALDGFRNFASRIIPKDPIQEPRSRISHTGLNSIFASNKSKSSGFPPYFPISQPSRIQFNKFNESNPFVGGAKRHYYVDRNKVQHFKPRGPRRWFQNPRNVLVVVLVGSGVLITVYYGNLETVPYTKRTHFVLLSKSMERRLGETQFEQMKAAFKGKILPAIHPESVRVRLIAKDIIEALQRGLRNEQVWSDLGYALESVGGVHEAKTHETLMALKEREEGKWFKEDEILDDKWVQQSRKKGQERGSQPETSHLDGLNWEVLVVNEPAVNAFCLPGGKIVVFTGLLEHFRTDSEIATIIGHEVGHAVARHAAEGITKNLWFAILQLILYQFIMPDIVNTMSVLFLRLPFSRRMEMEADYIGLLLMASAGYDPRVAPKVYEKLGKLTGESALRDYLSTHPSGKKRAQLLSQAQVMEEALTIYREVRSGRGIEGFL